ncbi:uncharacterized protein LOC128983542 [Macrosteles quadrilineatus]|uniref:uncharacterized protein LOC128983542 n=1 Tax=Macrosteles quadrilineatus TaxID=74068 RepID=UPI0023E13B60|nr:uncharacterized protein LOC128983542 [Macrosteles quadrilineatus]
MTSTTPDHDVARCHAAAENRRQLLCRLRCLADRLDECDRTALSAAGCGDLFNKGKGGRYVFPDPADTPLITFPENLQPDNDYKIKLPKKTAPWEPHVAKSQELIAGYMKKACDCLRRNGLQDQCELTQCQGRPLCLTTPVPLCPPSGGAGLMVTPAEAGVIIDHVDKDRCCRLDCCPGMLSNC